MQCSKPNLIEIDSRYRGSTFLGPRNQEKMIADQSNKTQFFKVYDIPCGKCELCRVDMRYSKALRIMLEAESWPESSYFITLTFDNDHLGNGELDHNEWSQFIKNFRQKFCQAKYCNLRDRGGKNHGREYSKTFKKIKQVMCGEYGDQFGRKHFHGIIFNHQFTDATFTGFYSKKNNPIYTSPSLAETWGKGSVQIEKVTFDLALYVGAYVTDLHDEPEANHGHKKKQYGRFGKGIGLEWISKYWNDVLISGRVKTLDRDYPVPRYFLKKIEEMFPNEYERHRREKWLKSLKLKKKLIEKGDGPLRRAKAKGRIFNHNKQKRSLDNGTKRISQTAEP